MLEKVLKRVAPFALALGLSASAVSCPLPEPSYNYAAEKQAVTKAADRIENLQNANGSWDWIVTDATGPTSTTYLNISGVTGEILLDAYSQTGQAKYLDAAKKTGDYIITETNKLPDAQLFNAFNMRFLNRLGDKSGNQAYSNFVIVKMNDLKNEVTYWKTPSKIISTDGVPGLTAEELVAAEEVIRGTSVGGIKPWDLYNFVELAKKEGDNDYAAKVADGIADYLNQPGYTESAADYELGLAAGIMGMKNAGKDYSTFLDRLKAKQGADGSFADSVQTTAYGLKALVSANQSTEAKKSADYLVNKQGYNGLDGWLESDGEEYSEATSEAGQALADYIPN